MLITYKEYMTKYVDVTMETTKKWVALGLNTQKQMVRNIIFCIWVSWSFTNRRKYIGTWNGPVCMAWSDQEVHVYEVILWCLICWGDAAFSKTSYLKIDRRQYILKISGHSFFKYNLVIALFCEKAICSSQLWRYYFGKT